MSYKEEKKNKNKKKGNININKRIIKLSTLSMIISKFANIEQIKLKFDLLLKSSSLVPHPRRLTSYDVPSI